MRTYYGTEDVAPAWILVSHTQIRKYCGLVLCDSGVVNGPHLWEFIGMYEVQGGLADEFMRFKA